MVDSNLKIELFSRVDNELLERERVDALRGELQEALDLNGRVDLRDLLQKARHGDLLDRLYVLHVVLVARVLSRLQVVEALVDALAQFERVELDLEALVEVANFGEDMLKHVVFG